MFAKYSVRKPMTVFVGVILVLLLGAVSFSRMTPDLLPNINMPYAVVVTAYPGATPEEVEEEVTKPLEEAFGSLDNISEMTSTSAENVSSVMLEFAEDVNMDTLTSEIREKINSVSGSWNDLVATPYIMKINPNMLPVTVAAMNCEGYDNEALTALLDTDLMKKLEGIEGVAAVDVNGRSVKEVSVQLSQEKIDSVNRRIKESLDKQFGEAEMEMNERKEEIDSGLSDTKEQMNTLKDQEAQMESGQEQLLNQSAQAQQELYTKQAELAAAQKEIDSALSELKSGLSLLNIQRSIYTRAQESLNEIRMNTTLIDETIVSLMQIQEDYPLLLAKKTELEAQLVLLEQDPVGHAEEMEALQLELLDVNGQIAALDSQLLLLATAYDQIPTRINELTAAKAAAEASLQAVAETLKEAGVDLETLDREIQKIDGDIAAAQSAQTQLQQTQKDLAQGNITINAALAELNKQQMNGIMQMSKATAQITSGQAALTSAQAQLEAAQAQMSTATEELDKQKKEAYRAANLNITVEMIASILTAQDFSMPAGYVEEKGVSTLVRVGNKLETPEELMNLMLFDTQVDSVGKIYLRDVAEVSIESNSDEIYAKLDGQEGLLLSFTKQATYSTAEVSANIDDRFQQLAEEYEGMQFVDLSDQGDYIYLVVNSVLENLLLGAVFAVLILLLFLKDIKPTIVIAFSIPISLLMAIVLMYFSGVTLNVISLSGLAVGVGMLVDNSVVVIENIYRLRSEGASAARAAVYGTTQVSGAVFASTLTTICVFLPIVFIEGLTRDLFADMALTIGYALLASFFVAVTLVPAMSSTMLRKTKQTKFKLFDQFVQLYERLARVSLRHKWVVLTLSVVLLAASAVAVIQRGAIFMPSMSGKQISVTISMHDAEASYQDKTRLMDDISGQILEIDGVASIGAIVNSEAAGTMMIDTGDSDMIAYVILEEDTSRKDKDISNEIVRLCEERPCDVAAQGAMDMSAYMSAMGGSGVTMKIYGDDSEALIRTAKNIADLLEDVEGITEISSGVEDTNPEIRIEVNKNLAMEKGLTTAQVFESIRTMISSEATPTRMRMDQTTNDVVVYNAQNGSMDEMFLRELTIRSSNMTTGEAIEVPLKDIAYFRDTESLNTIAREGQRRYVSVSGTIAEGYNVALVTREAERKVQQYRTEGGIRIESAGENETIMEALSQLGFMAVLAIVIIYLIMVIQFQSLLSPFIVMFTIPLAFTGGFAALYLCGMEISVVSAIGFIMLAGIVVNNGIVLVDYINQLRLEGMEKREAIIKACTTRMRPVLMTVVTTVMGLIFMALANGVGAELMQPIAIVCIGGLIYGTVMTLLVVPAMYDLFNRKELKRVAIEDEEEGMNRGAEKSIKQADKSETSGQLSFEDISSKKKMRRKGKRFK